MKNRRGLVTRLKEAADGNYNSVKELQTMCGHAADLIEALRKDLRDITHDADRAQANHAADLSSSDSRPCLPANI